MGEAVSDRVWLFQWFLQIAGRIQKILGSEYMRIALQHMGNYLGTRIGETPPVFETIDSFRSYGLERIEKVEDPWNAFLYGVLAADRDYRASLKRGESGFEKFAELILEASLIGKEPFDVSDIGEAAQKFYECLKSIRVDIPTSIQVVDSDTLDVVVGDCPYKGCCRTVQAESLFRDDGTPFCWVIKLNCSGILRLSDVPVDYRLLEFDAPDCRGIILRA
ncbi:MAG: hypothetical protein ACTSSA_08115 [Candidatus Freyarchaeota archaeon]